jgi:myo-inositol catabolism protein IolC
MVQAIHELPDAGVDPDVWKIEGLDRKDDCRKIVTAARRAGRDRVGCIVLGRHESDAKVEMWLTNAVATPGFIGFAVGRTTFWHPLVDYRAGRIARDVAAARIAASYNGWVQIFEKAKAGVAVRGSPD